MDLDEKEHRQLLKEEYFFLQQQYEDFDRRSLTIKGWLSSGSAAALAISLSTSTHRAYLVPPIIIILSGVFWYLEAHWKLFQSALADRIRVIEAHFRSDPDIFETNPAPLQIYHAWFQSYLYDRPIYPYEASPTPWGIRPRSHATRLRDAAKQRFVYLPYAPTMLIAGVLFAVIVFTNP